jgi:hypothetical protein
MKPSGTAVQLAKSTNESNPTLFYQACKAVSPYTVPQSQHYQKKTGITDASGMM